MTAGGSPRTAPDPDVIRRIFRLLSALADGIVAGVADKENVAAIERRWPGIREQVLAAREFHARAVTRAVTLLGARGLIACPVGYPASPEPHLTALEAVPSTRVVLAAPDEEAAMIGRVVWAPDPRVEVIQSLASDAESLMGRGEVKMLTRPRPGGPRVPVCLLLPWVASLLPAGTAARMLKEYGRLLPAGSTVILSWFAPDGGPAGEDLVAAWRRHVSPAWGHTTQDVSGWLEAAGMEILRCPRDVRATRERQWLDLEYARRPPGRIAAAVGRIPLERLAAWAGGRDDVFQPGGGRRVHVVAGVVGCLRDAGALAC